MNALFIHIPKTAGATIAHALQTRRIGQLGDDFRNGETFKGRLCFKHRFYIDIPEEAKNRFTFTFSRDPYDRAVSSWAYSNSRVSFVECMRRMCSRQEMENDLTRIFNPQYRWHEGVDFDFIGRYEHLQEDIEAVRGMIDAPVQRTGNFNKSEHKPYQEYYDEEPEAIDLVRTIYKKDFELLGYPM